MAKLEPTIRERVVQVISEQLNVPLADITDEKHIINDLAADSLDTVELSLGLEDEFDIVITDEQEETLTTVSAIINFIEFRLIPSVNERVQDKMALSRIEGYVNVMSDSLRFARQNLEHIQDKGIKEKAAAHINNWLKNNQPN